MSDGLSIDTRQVQSLSKRYAKAEPIVRGEMVTAMKRSTLAVEGRAKQVVPVDTAHLRRSITSKVTQSAGAVVGKVGTNVPYARPVEEGRRAGAPMPPPSALTGWARRHGMEGAEFVLARSIGRRGIKARPFLTRALREMTGQIRQEFALVPKRILSKLGAR
ncbi:MAG: HK97 gp10 family phage protein [Actinomycetota bacterium]|nr:HK97 gp10 family phage protein [Actinomycetota bacterium]